MPHERMPKLPAEGLSKSDAKEALIEAGRRVVGSGSECVVESFPGNESKVAAHSFRENIRARIIFYNHRVLEILFPDNFLHVHAAFEHTDERRGGTIRERAHIEKRGPYGTVGRWFSGKSFERVKKDLVRMGIDPVGFDPAFGNFGREADGYEKYLDTNPHIGLLFVSHREQVLSYMRNKNYSREDMAAVNSSLDRIDSLLQKEREDRVARQNEQPHSEDRIVE